MFEKNLLAGRTIFLTGGGTGLGRSMALRMASLGAKLFLVGRREDPLVETAGQIRAAGGTAAHATADVRDPAAVESAVAAAEREFGKVDILINNAAGNFIARTEKISPNAFAAVVGIVLHGSFHCTLALGQRWIAAQQAGTVLNIVTTYAAAELRFGIRRPIRVCKSGGAGHDSLARRGMGTSQHSAECHRPGPLSHRGRLVPLDAHQGI